MSFIELDEPSMLPKTFDPDEIARTSAARGSFRLAEHLLGNYKLKNETATYIQNVIYRFHTHNKRDIRKICFILWRKYGISLRLIVKYAKQL